MVLGVPATVQTPGAQFTVVRVVDISVVAQMQFPMVLTVQKI